MTSQTARIVRLLAPGQLVFEDQPLPPLREGEILCETLCTAISPGTEIAAYTGMAPLRPGPQYPRFQGYCNVARVLQSGVADLPPGCRVLSFTSHRSHFILSASDVLYRLPDEADAIVASTAYLFHLGYNAVLRSGVRAGSRVVVIGLGTLGLTSVAMAVLAGAEVWAVSNHSKPSEVAIRFGARGTYRRDQRSGLDAEIPHGADVVINTVNNWADWRVGLELASQNGVIACLGFPGRGQPIPEQPPLPAELFYMKQLRIESVGWSPENNDSRSFLRFNERENLAWISRQIESGRLDASAIISGRFRADDIRMAYDALASRNHSPVTFVLDWTK